MTQLALLLRHLCHLLVLMSIAVATSAQAAGPTDGLADAERVLRESVGSDAMDTQRQRFGALAVLQLAARKVSTLDGAKPAPDDVAKVNGYNRALQQVMREVAQTGAPDCQGEACPAAVLRRATSDLMRHEDFVRGVFERFATPAWREAHLAMVMARPGAPTAGGSLAATAAATPPTSTSTAAPMAAAPSPPTIAAAPPSRLGEAAAARPRPATAAPAAAQGATGAAGDFAFLAEMPVVERVRAEIVGSDPVDTKVQLEATFHMLAMDVMLTMRGGSPQVPARFSELDRAYKAEVLRLERELRAEVAPSTLSPTEQGQRWAPVFRQLMGYQSSAAFRQQTFQRFFSADFLAAYEEKKSGFESWRAGAMAGPTTVTTAGTAAATGGTAVAARPAPAATAAAPPPEPPRELRSSTGVDMMVLGVPMGEPLRLPLCPSTAQGSSPLATALAGLERAFAPTTTVCQNVSATSASGRNALSIKLPSNRCPEWLNILCLVSGTLHNGRVAQLELGTRGLDVEEGLVEILRAKYGKPSRSKRVKWSNNVGGQWEAEELTWDLKDLVVEFKPMVGRRDIGRIIVTTAEGRRFLETERKREDAAQPRL